MKYWIAAVAVALLIGVGVGYRLAPTPKMEEKIVQLEGETKERVVTKTVTVREPSGRIVEEKVESKAVNTRVKSVARETQSVAVPERKHRVTAALNPLDRSDWTVGYGYRVAGPLWIESSWQQKQKAVTLGIGVEF